MDVRDPEWYTALHLGERRELFEAHPSRLVEPEPIADEILEEWATRDAFEDRADFHARLALEGLDEQRFHQLIGQPAELIRDLHDATPEWLLALAEAFTPPYVEAGAQLPSPEGMEADRLKLGDLARPVIARGHARLRDRIAALRDAAEAGGLDLSGADELFLPTIFWETVFHSQRMLALELHVFRLEGRLRGETPEERFADFVGQLSDPEVAVRLLAEYSVLARRLVHLVDDWVTVAGEFLERLVRDWADLQEQFGLGEGPQRLVEARANAGDRHRGGRSVHLLTFSSGAKLVYKPRSMAVDRHFQDLVAWTDEALDGIDLAGVGIIDRGDYGWMEFLEHGRAESLEAVQRFHERQGVYLALLYALHATDMHNENILASGEHPHVVDVEALLHPRVRRSQFVIHDNPARELLDNSVYEIGLLPRRVWVGGGDDEGGLDISALGGQGGQSSPDRLPTMVEVGTDEMRIVREHVSMPKTDNLPSLAEGDGTLDPEDFVEEVVRGFETAYALIAERADELLGEGGPIEAFRHDELRQIVRPTRTYALRVLEGSHPDHLRDALEYDQFLDGLWIGPSHDDAMPDVFARERADLLDSDIPFFSTRPGSPDLFHDSGLVFEGYAHRAGLELAKDTITGMCDEDRERQVWFIRASYTALELGEQAAAWPTFAAHVPEQPVSRSELIDAATAVGERIATLAISGDEVASWLGLELIAERVWTLQPATQSLFSGVSGIALALGQLGAVTGRKDFTELALRGIAGVVAQWEQTREQLERVEAPPGLFSVGAFGQLSGVIYALCHLGSLSGEARWLEEAAVLGALMPQGIAEDEEYDIIAGSAGGIGVLRSLMAVDASPQWLEIATTAGDRLVGAVERTEHGTAWPSESASRPLTGFSHGAAGGAWALSELAALCRAAGRDPERAQRYESVAREALAYERGAFDAEHRNWPDFRELPGSGSGSESGEVFMTAWCHGAPGVGMSRVEVARRLEDPALDEEIDVAVSTTLRSGLGLNHSLCHGSVGNLLLPQVVALEHDDSDLEQRVYREAGGVLDAIGEVGWLTGVPQGVETPGLMAGLAGIAHGLLRLAAPEQVPSVLTLQPPAADQGS